MFEGECDLTFEEEALIEQPANLYSIVRTMDFIEWAYNTGHIDKDLYIEQTNIILDQYRTSCDAQDKFRGIDDFAQKYGLTDCKLGINRLKQGAVQITTTSNSPYSLILNLTQKFNDLANSLYMHSSSQTSELLVSEIFPLLKELILYLNGCKNIINIECDEIQKLFAWFDRIKNLKAADKISAEDEKQILLDVNMAYDKFTKLLNK